MRYLWKLVLLSLGLSLPGYAQQLGWESPMTFSPLSSPVFSYIRVLANGNYLVSGVGYSGGANFPFISAQFQTNGTLVRQFTGRTLGTLEQDILPLGGNGSILLAASIPARTVVGGSSTSRLFFQRIRPNGDTLPGVTYPVGLLEGFPTRTVRDGDSVRVLTFAVDALGQGQYALLTTDTSGVLGQVRRYPKPVFGDAYPCDLVRTPRGGWLIIGEAGINAITHPYLTEVDVQGRLRRQRNLVLFANSTEERVVRVRNNLIKLQDGSGYVFGGWQKTGGQTWGFLAKLDTALNVVWTYRHPPQATTALAPQQVYELADGTLSWLVGDEATNTGGRPTPYLYFIRVSAGGQLLSQQRVSSANCSKLRLYAWQPLAGGGALVVGGYGSNCLATPGAAAAAYVARIDNATLLAATAPTAPASLAARLWPNPATASATWQGTVPVGAGPAELVLLDGLGRVVQRVAVAGRGAAVQQALALSGLPAGSYTCRLLVGGQPSGGAQRLTRLP